MKLNGTGLGITVLSSHPMCILAWKRLDGALIIIITGQEMNTWLALQSLPLPPAPPPAKCPGSFYSHFLEVSFLVIDPETYP